MSQSTPKSIRLQSGYYFSPGFYLNYWKNSILNNFDANTVAFGRKLKQHREIWIGAHLAALKTKLSRNKYFVALPDSDPPDALIGTFSKIIIPSGRTGHELNWFPVEITRCDASSEEDLYDQIIKKNTAAYEKVVLAVYLQGAEKIPDLKSLLDKISVLPKVYLHEIIIMVQLKDDDADPAAGTYGFVQVFPGYETEILNRNDPDSFFLEPNAMQITGRGIQSEKKRLGSIILLPPEI